jgi:hypothetical protein
MDRAFEERLLRVQHDPVLEYDQTDGRPDAKIDQRLERRVHRLPSQDKILSADSGPRLNAARIFFATVTLRTRVP